MQEAGRLLEKDEVVVEAPSGDEGILARADQLIELRGDAEREHLGEQLCDQVNQEDGP
jgi:hypothetical protein